MPALTRLSGLGVAALSLLATTAVAATGHGSQHHPVKRQSQTAIVGPGGSVQPRLEIRQLEQDNAQWNLFMLAMDAFQNSDHTDVMSWYQLAGIHGMPYEAWNGVNGPNGGTGYCPHSSPLFICWHRPYVAAWEQQMLVHAAQIAGQFQGADAQTYQTALQTLRHPYWDWAEIPPSGNSADTMPQSMTNATIQVTTPSGSQTIPNPLYAFTKMNPHDQSDFSGVGGGDWNEWGSTLRYPTSQDASARSNQGAAVQQLGDYNSQARAQVYRVLTACTNFLDISNDGVAEQNSNCGVSLESIHNGIHTFTGGQNQPGHMTYNNFAAFDPAFFLHHANVDRLFAIWQGLHPGSYMTAGNQGSSATFTINANAQVDANTALEPFHGANGQAHTCNSVRDTSVFAYTYPELSSGNLAQTVNNLYGSNAVPQQLSSRSSSSSSASSTSSASSSATSASSSTIVTTTNSAGSTVTSASPISGSSTGASSSTVTTTDSAGNTVSTVVPGSSAPGSSQTITTTDSAGSAISTVVPGSSAPGSSQTITTTDSAGSTISTVVPAPSGPGSSQTITTTNSAGSTISTVVPAPSGPSGPSGGSASTVVTTNSQGQTITTTLPTSSDLGGPGSIISGVQVSNGATNAPTGTGSSPFPTVSGTIPGLGNSTTNSSRSDLPGLLTPTGRTHDYTCHVVSEKHGLGGTYTVFGFLGTDVPDTPDSWTGHPNFCGAHSIFAPLGVPTSNTMLVSGQISLTTSLVGKVAAGQLKSLDEADVLPYLAANLNWKVATAAGKVVDNSQVPGLTVGAVAQKVMPAANAGSLPTYGNGVPAPNCTHGKAGGLQNGMQYDWWNNCAAQPVAYREL